MFQSLPWQRIGDVSLSAYNNTDNSVAVDVHDTSGAGDN